MQGNKSKGHDYPKVRKGLVESIKPVDEIQVSEKGLMSH